MALVPLGSKVSFRPGGLGSCGQSRRGGGLDLPLQRLDAFPFTPKPPAPDPLHLNPGSASPVGEALQLEVVKAETASPVLLRQVDSLLQGVWGREEGPAFSLKDGNPGEGGGKTFFPLGGGGPAGSLGTGETQLSIR